MAVGNERLLGQHMTTKLRPDECRHETRFRAAIISHESAMCAVKLDTRPTARNFKRKIVSEDH